MWTQPDLKTYSECQKPNAGPSRPKSTQASSEQHSTKATRKKVVSKFSRDISSLKVANVLGFIEKNFHDERTEKNIIATLSLAKRILKNGRNVCFYGYGSKDEEMRSMVDRLRRKFTVIFVNAFYSDVLPRTMLLKILDAVLQTCPQALRRENQPRDDMDQLAAQIVAASAHVPDQKFLLVICGLDGPNFLRKSTLEVLTRLVEMKTFKILASLDSASLPLFLTRSTSDGLNFVYLPLSTFRAYRSELLYIDSSIPASNDRKDLKTIRKLLAALTSNQKELVIFVLHKLVTSQRLMIEEQELFGLAVAHAKVTSFHQFQENLKEAIAYKLIDKKLIDGYSYVYKTSYTKDDLAGLEEMNFPKEKGVIEDSDEANNEDGNSENDNYEEEDDKE